MHWNMFMQNVTLFLESIAAEAAKNTSNLQKQAEEGLGRAL